MRHIGRWEEGKEGQWYRSGGRSAQPTPLRGGNKDSITDFNHQIWLTKSNSWTSNDMWCRERNIFASIIKGWSILNTAHDFYNVSNQWFVILSEKEDKADQTLITQKDKSDWCTYCAV